MFSQLRCHHAMGKVTKGAKAVAKGSQRIAAKFGKAASKKSKRKQGRKAQDVAREHGASKKEARGWKKRVKNFNPSTMDVIQGATAVYSAKRYREASEKYQRHQKMKRKRNTYLYKNRQQPKPPVVISGGGSGSTGAPGPVISAG